MQARGARCCPNCPNPSADCPSGHISVLPVLLIFRGFLIFAWFLYSRIPNFCRISLCVGFLASFGKFGAKVWRGGEVRIAKAWKFQKHFRNLWHQCICSALHSRTQSNVEMKKKSHRKSGCLICCSGIEGCLVQTIRVKWRTNCWYNLQISIDVHDDDEEYLHGYAFQIEVNCFPVPIFPAMRCLLVLCCAICCLERGRGWWMVSAIGKWHYKLSDTI